MLGRLADVRLLKITTFYSDYVDRFYRERPELSRKGYAEQKACLDYDAFGWADFWANALAPLGYDATEIIANIEPLQKAWAAENGVDAARSADMARIAFEQVRQLRPEILFMEAHRAFEPGWFEEVKRACPSLKLVIGWCGVPFQDVSIFKAYDLVLSNVPELVDALVGAGKKSIHLNHAFDPRILERIRLDNPPAVDFSFVGQIVRGGGMHDRRESVLRALAQERGIAIHSPMREAGGVERLKIAAGKTIRGDLREAWRSMRERTVSAEIRRNLKPSVFGLNMYQTLRDSKVTFNCHIAISSCAASNMRMFEATGVGTCLITDWKEKLHELFEPDQEVVAYKSAQECVEKVKWLLDHPRQREAIASAGQKRTLRDHHFFRRAERLNDIITHELRDKRLPA